MGYEAKSGSRALDMATGWGISTSLGTRLAAAALAQTVGFSIGYGHIAMLFVEPEHATLAGVDVAVLGDSSGGRQIAEVTPGIDRRVVDANFVVQVRTG